MLFDLIIGLSLGGGDLALSLSNLLLELSDLRLRCQVQALGLLLRVLELGLQFGELFFQNGLHLESLLQISSEVVGLIVSQLLFISDLGVGILQIFDKLVFSSSLLKEVTLENCVAQLRFVLLLLKITSESYDSLIEQFDLVFEISNLLCSFFFFLVDFFRLIGLILGIVCGLVVRLRVCLLLRILHHRVEPIHWSNRNWVHRLRRE